MATPPRYATYDEVPTLRKQWFFWVTWFLLAPIAIIILITGDVYYVKKGEVRSFGHANRLVAALIGLLWIFGIIGSLMTGVES